MLAKKDLVILKNSRYQLYDSSFSDFLLNEKNIDIGVRGYMEPVTDTNKNNINQTASMLIAAIANKNNKKEKEHSCGCPHNK